MYIAPSSPDVVHRYDVGMAELRHGSGLANQARDRALVGGAAVELERHRTAQARIRRAVDDTHDALAEQRLDPQLAHHLARGQHEGPVGHGRHLA